MARQRAAHVARTVVAVRKLEPENAILANPEAEKLASIVKNVPLKTAAIANKLSTPALLANPDISWRTINAPYVTRTADNADQQKDVITVKINFSSNKILDRAYHALTTARLARILENVTSAAWVSI
jgi:hypothetical protein